MRIEAVQKSSKHKETDIACAVPEALRTLLSLTAGHAEPNDAPSTPSHPVEEVLVDTEVDGCRYLLVRLPLPNDRARLSPREYEIVRMVAKGHPNKVIADVLCISSWTVCTHLRRIFAKLGVASRAAMIARLSEVGGLKGDHHPPTRSNK
jgi:DNA-binding CsgD family transcriptional regulator